MILPIESRKTIFLACIGLLVVRATRSSSPFGPSLRGLSEIFGSLGGLAIDTTFEVALHSLLFLSSDRFVGGIVDLDLEQHC